MKNILLPMFVTLLFAFPLSAQTEDSFKKYTSSYSSGNQKAEFEYLENYVLNNPLSPESAVYIQMIASFYNIKGYEAVNSVLRKYEDLVAKSSSADKNEILFNLHFIEKNLNENFTVEESNEELTFIDKWKMSQNFIHYGYADLQFEFDPELNSNFKNKNATASKDSYIRIDENSFAEKGIYYFKSSFTSSSKINLVVESSDYYKIFINGKEAGVNFYQGTFRNRRIFSAEGDGSYTVMIKMLAEKNSSFRVSAVNYDFSKAEIKFTETDFPAEVNASERMLFPFSDLMKRNDVPSMYALAKYFYFLSSSEFIPVYEKIIKKDPSQAYKTLYGSDLVDFHSASSVKSVYGWKILSAVWLQNNAPVPALFYRFQQKLDEGNAQDAFKIADEVRKRADYYPLEYTILNYYYEKNYEKLFLAQHERMKKIFPGTYNSDIYLMDYYNVKNNTKSKEIGLSISKKIRSEKVLKNLLYQYKSSGKYDEALSCLDGTIYTPYRENIERGKIFILQKKFAEAKQIFLKLLAQNESPEILYYLGSIEVSENRTADLYWGKLYSLEPEYEFPQDYLGYSEERKLVNEFDAYRNNEYVNSEIIKFQQNVLYYPPSVAYRANMIRIYNNYKSRYFQEELLYIKNDSEISSKGEYRIPVDSNYTIIKAEVINRDGSVSASYKKNKTSNGVYLSINGIRKNCLVHVIYEINNYDFTWYNSALFAGNYIQMLNFREGAGKLEVKIITELNDLILYNNKNAPVKVDKNGNINIYSFEMNNIREIENEYYSGDSRRNLPAYGFTNVTSAESFTRWYKGFFPQYKDILVPAEISITDKMTAEQKVNAVYDFVSRTVTTEGNLFYYPSDPDDVLYLKKGSSEDKVFFSRQLLKQYGIESFPALVRDENLNVNSIYMKDSFTGIFLYVPSLKLWLDFSSEYLPAGCVRDTYDGSQALVIKNDAVEKIKVTAANETSVNINADIDLSVKDETFYKMKTVYSGNYNYLRYYFKDVRQHGTIVSAIASMNNPGIIAKDFSVSSITDFSVPFSIESSGSILGFSLLSDESLSLNPFLMKTGFLNYLYDNKRNFDLIIDLNERSEENYTIKLSDEYKNPKILIEKTLSYGPSFVQYSLKKEKNSSFLKVYKKTDFKKQIIPVDKFEEFKIFSLSVREMDNYRVLLKKEN